jgi:uncharacterized protein (TIGR03437 family)
VSVILRQNGTETIVNGVQVTTVQPGIFETIDSLGRKYAVAMHANGDPVTIENPARLGEQIRAFFTGGGNNLTPRPNLGAFGIGQPYGNSIIVGVNGAAVKVISVQYSVGMVGVYDVVFELPTTVAPGDNPNALATGPDRPFQMAITPAGSSTLVFANNAVIPVGPKP